MSVHLDELYLDWLYRQVANADDKVKFWTLAKTLFSKEFIWFVPNDDNRALDGRMLREEFISEMHFEDVDPDWFNLGCSMLELLIGLSRRLAFLEDDEPWDWFWILINNLGIRYSDRRPFPQEVVDDVLDAVIWRTYKRNGDGGLFPLKRTKTDQREVEIWYQLSSYLLERGL